MVATPVILDTGGVKMGKIAVWSQLRQNVKTIPSQLMAGWVSTFLSSPATVGEAQIESMCSPACT
jgi:hypothetical protein